MPKWRYRCPEGHAALRFRSGFVRCDSCKETYPRSEIYDLAEPYDRKRWEREGMISND